MILLIFRYPWKGRNVQIPRLCFCLPLFYHAPEFRQFGIDCLVGVSVVAAHGDVNHEHGHGEQGYDHEVHGLPVSEVPHAVAGADAGELDAREDDGVILLLNYLLTILVDEDTLSPFLVEGSAEHVEPSLRLLTALGPCRSSDSSGLRA